MTIPHQNQIIRFYEKAEIYACYRPQATAQKPRRVRSTGKGSRIISATEAARSFSELLDRVCYRGETFIIERGGARGAADIALAGAGVAIHPQRGREALQRSRALAEVLVHDELIAAPPTSLNEPIGASRRLAVIEVPLDELKGIKRSLGGTVNDVALR